MKTKTLFLLLLLFAACEKKEIPEPYAIITYTEGMYYVGDTITFDARYSTSVERLRVRQMMHPYASDSIHEGLIASYVFTNEGKHIFWVYAIAENGWSDMKIINLIVKQ